MSRCRRRLGIGLLALLVVACTAETAETVATTTAPLSTTSTAAPPTTTSTTTTPVTTTTEQDPAQQTTALVEAFMAAWDSHDPDEISSFYADDVSSYDATAGGVPFTKDDIDGVLFGPYGRGAFDVVLTSYFVSPDGRFAATLGTFAQQDGSGSLVSQPYVALLAFVNGKVSWVYDYYGGAPSETEAMITVTPSTAEPGSPEAQAAASATAVAVGRWLAAYNARNAESFLSSYAENIRYVDVVSPQWRVLTRDGLEEDIASHFPRSEFESQLGASEGSPIDSFFVSGDGRYAAVQGAYHDEGTIIDKPMAVILELQGGLIVQQYNFMVMDRDLLQP
jgi:ketosteroid isomerase-like protein